MIEEFITHFKPTMAGLDCPRDFECVKSYFRGACKVKDMPWGPYGEPRFKRGRLQILLQFWPHDPVPLPTAGIRSQEPADVSVRICRPGSFTL